MTTRLHVVKRPGMSGATPSVATRFQCVYKNYAFVMETNFAHNEVQNNISYIILNRTHSK